jgi:uncharacterized radical SAM protein YgiQ
MPFHAYPPLSFRGKKYLPSSKHKGNYDVIIISGDAYVDHPSFSCAVIYRCLERLGLKVAVIAQPDVLKNEDFQEFGEPKLFFAVVSGVMDSMVANYTAAKMPRSTDRLSPKGQPKLRPKRALIAYTQKLKELYKNSSIVIGGIEGSLRRFVHYDYWENRLRDPILFDAHADILIYGMAEAVLEKVVNWYKSGSKDAPPQIAQTCIKTKKGHIPENLKGRLEYLPSVENCRASKEKFMQLSARLDVSVVPSQKVLVQEHPKGNILCFSPTEEDLKGELDVLNKLSFNRRSHPIYGEEIPGIVPVQFSIQSHRGCLSACSFCALSIHQGRYIRSRAKEEILAEIASFTKHPDFKGVVPDVGGPSVNMYGWSCKIGGCNTRMCVYPKICKHLVHSLKPLAELLKAAAKLPGVKKVFVGSGIRYDLIREDEWDLFEYIVFNHVSGQLKVAPEHFNRKVLTLMRKGENADFGRFVGRFYRSCSSRRRKLFVVPYLMTAFPGCDGADKELAHKIKELNLVHEQIQEFTPTPGSLASAMYYTEQDWRCNAIKVAKNEGERKQGRRLIQRRKKP